MVIVWSVVVLFTVRLCVRFAAVVGFEGNDGISGVCVVCSVVVELCCCWLLF